MTTPLPDLSQYIAGARRRAIRQQQAQLQRYQAGRKVAQQAASLLKTQWGASKVILFGSMMDSHKVHTHSDIDLAVWGLPEANYYRALGQLLDLNDDFSIDLVEVQHAKPHILQAIEDGIEL